MTETIQTQPDPRQTPFGKKELERLINPKSVVVIGASKNPTSFGNRTLVNINVGYKGKVYGVNPKYDKVNGIPCFASLEDLPEVPDCAILAVPREAVIDQVERLAAIGAGGAIVFASGYTEVGRPERIAEQLRLAEIARESGMRISGPNCVGLINLKSRIGMTFMPFFNKMPLKSGPIGLVSQSGAVGYNILQGLMRNVGFSHYLAPGNSCDVDVLDFVNYLVDDDETKAIACAFEGIRDGDRLIKVGMRALEAGKPLVIFKTGLSDISRQAALSHTGTIAGSNEAYIAALERVGAILVDNCEELLETTSFLAKTGEPRVGGVGIMSASGGGAVMASDKADKFDIALPAPSENSVEILSEVIPEFGSTANPCDLTAESLKSDSMYANCISAFANDPVYGAVVIPMNSAQKNKTESRAQALCDLSETLDVPLCVVWLSEWIQGPGSYEYDAHHKLNMFRSMERCFKAIQYWQDYYENRDEKLKDQERRLSSNDAATNARKGLGNSNSRSLSEGHSKSILAAYDIPTTREGLVQSIEEAITIATDIGFPVVLKAESADIPHKSEAGVVKLSLGDEAAVRNAYQEIMDAVSRIDGSPSLDGVSVQEMVKPGIEFMVGARYDTQFGPMIMCGLGGVWVELMKDVSISLAPVDRRQARNMISSLKGYPLLTGFRGSEPIDENALIDLVCRVSELASDLSNEIDEIDVNPVILSPERSVAVDALIVRKTSELE